MTTVFGCAAGHEIRKRHDGVVNEAKYGHDYTGASRMINSFVTEQFPILMSAVDVGRTGSWWSRSSSL